MKYKVFKKCKDYEEIYTKEKEAKALDIELDEVTIWITEQQLGTPIREPHVEIAIKGDCSYSMDLSTFIKKIST